VTETADPNPNLIINGGFESGLAPWVYGANSGSGNFVSPGQGGSSTAYQLTTNGGSTYVSQTFNTVPGQQYRVSYYQSFIGGNCAVQVFYAQASNGNYASMQSDPAGTFVQNQFAFVANAATTTLGIGVQAIYCPIPYGSITGLVDNVVVVKA